MPALIIAIVLLLSASAGGGLSLASQGAQPGDTLYPVKLTLDGLQSSLDGGDTTAKQAEDAGSRSGGHTLTVTSDITATLTATPTAIITPTATVTPTTTVTPTATVTPTTTVTPTATVTPTVDADLDFGKSRPTVTISGTLGITFTNTISDVKGLDDGPDIKGLADGQDVPGESYNGLLAKLHAAAAAVARGQDKVAIDNLDAFLNELNAMQRSGRISTTDYEALYADYSSIVGALGSTPNATVTPVPNPTPDPSSGDDQPSLAPDKGHRPDMNTQHGWNQSQPDGSDTDATPTPVPSPAPSMSPTPDSSGAQHGKPEMGRQPGSDHSSAPSSPGKSGDRRQDIQE